VRFAKVPEILYQWQDLPDRASRKLDNYSANKFYGVKASYFAKWWTTHHNERQIWIWGYGKSVFNKVKPLFANGIDIEGYIDIQKHPMSTRKVSSIKSIQLNNSKFYLIYLGDRQGKVAILNFFNKIKMYPGRDYLFMC